MTRRRRSNQSKSGSQQGPARATGAPAPKTPKRDRVAFNEGKVIMHLARTTYTTLIQVIAEAVQNGLDAHASKIWIIVDERSRSISISDDGDGVTSERFREALHSVGQGVKTPGSIGRYGLGLISPLDKCEYFTFSSRTDHRSTGQRWTFRKSEIETQSEGLTIPVADYRWPADTTYNTILRIHRYTKDTQTAAMTPDRICEFVQNKLGPAMRKHGVTCTLHFKGADGTGRTEVIKPTEFQGEAFPVVTYEEADAGTVEFELYRARKTTEGRKGEVMFSEMDALYPITWAEFKRQAGAWLTDEVKLAFNSGYFEGIIRVKNIELHPNRRKFVWDDKAVGLCGALEEWYREVGHTLYTDEQVQEQEVRYQRLGVQTLERLKELLGLDGFEHLHKVLDALKEGTIASGHAEVESGKDTARPGLRSGQGGANQPREPRDTPTPPRDPDRAKGPERPRDHPGVSYGPEGQPRNVVRDNSTGVGIVHETLPGSDRLWEVDPRNAMIYINVRHPVFLLVERADTFILQLQEWIIIQALTMLQYPVDSWELLHDFSDGHAREFVTVSILGGAKRRKHK